MEKNRQDPVPVFGHSGFGNDTSLATDWMALSHLELDCNGGVIIIITTNDLCFSHLMCGCNLLWECPWETREGVAAD